MTVVVLNALLRPLLEQQLPSWAEPRWYASKQEALDLAPDAEIGWFDMYSKADMTEAISRATQLRWLNSVFAGVESFPLDLLSQRGVVLTNGAGINAIPIAEFVVMTMLGHAKGYREIVRAQDRREWLRDAPGKRELWGGKALILGYGAIGKAIEQRLCAFGMEVAKVRRTPGGDALAPDQWRGRLGEFDWVIMALPATPETELAIGAAELAAMKRDAVLINVGRGSAVDQAALTEALAAKRIGGAVLDVTTPEPLAPDDPLWGIGTAQITMHLSGRAQERMFERAAARFIDNLGRYSRGEPLEPAVDYARGY